MRISSTSLLITLTCCFFSLLPSQETPLKATLPSEEPPIAKALPAACHGEEVKKKKEIEEKKKEEDFKVNLYKQHSQLRKSGGTPQTPRQRSIDRNRLPTPKFSWSADESKPLTKLVIKLEEQKIYGFQDSTMVMSSDISSGKEAYATKTGSYKVIQKSIAHKSNLYGSFVNSKGVLVDANAKVSDPVPPGLRYVPSPMPFFLRLTHQGLGLHTGILPGYAASHGCVRLPAFIAEKLFATVPLGTVVEIFP